MSVYDIEDTDSTANAILLFISAAFYQLPNAIPGGATMEEMLNAIADDLEIDGKIDGISDLNISTPADGTAIVSSLDDAARLLNPDVIKENLALYSLEKTGAVIPVPDISFLVDNDGDGIRNNLDSDDDGDGIADTVDESPYQFEINLQGQTLSIVRNTSVQLSLQYNTPENPIANQVFPSIVLGPSFGSLDDNLIYTPNPGFTGTDEIVLSVFCTTCPATGFKLYESNEATITIHVQE